MLLLVPPAPGIIFIFFWVLFWGFWYCFDPKCREIPGWYKMGVYRFGTVWRLGCGVMGFGCGCLGCGCGDFEGCGGCIEMRQELG